MYSVVENAIKQGGYNLNEIIRKIDSLWVKGSLTDTEKDSLIVMARSGARVENSLDILAKFDDLEKRLRALESGKGEDTSNEATTEYPEYVDGKWYYAGDKVSFEGTNYTCIAPDGVVCVWSPSAYPTYWEEVV